MCRQPKVTFFRGGGFWKRPLLGDFLAFCCGCWSCWSVYMWLMLPHSLRFLWLLLVSFSSCSAALLNIIVIIEQHLSSNSGRWRWARKNLLRNALWCDVIRESSNSSNSSNWYWFAALWYRLGVGRNGCEWFQNLAQGPRIPLISPSTKPNQNQTAQKVYYFWRIVYILS